MKPTLIIDIWKKHYMNLIKLTYSKNKNLINNILGSYLIKGLALLISFFTIPAYMKYFDNKDALGMWFTLLSLIQWILIFDLGLGNGLRNKLVPLLLNKDHVEIKKYVSSTYFVIGIISLITLIVGIPSIYLVNWNEVFNIPESLISAHILKQSIFIIFIGIVLQLFLKTILSILYAMKKVVLSNFIALLSTATLLIYVLLFNSGSLTDKLINLSWANLISSNLPVLISTFFVFKLSLSKSTPNISYIDKKISIDVIKLGGSFFYIQILLLVINSTNEILITWLFGPSYVVEYLIYFKLFHLSVTFFSLLSNPVWSEVSELFVHKNYKKIKAIFNKLNLVVFLTFIANMLILLFLQFIFDLWLKENSITVNYYYGFVFVIFSTISIFNISISIFANAFAKLKPQLILFTVAMVIKIPLVILVSFLLPTWIGVVISTTIILLPYALVQPRLLFKNLN